METVVQKAWAKSKLLVKTGIVGVILLLLQIPTYYVEQLIAEREGRQKEATAEVSGKWAGRQNLVGPVLVVPFLDPLNLAAPQQARAKHLAYFLPDELVVNAGVAPIEKHRGIYKVMLYASRINLAGRFHSVQPAKLGLLPENMLWNEAFVRLSVSDSKGLNDEVKLKVADSTLFLTPNETGGDGNNGLFARVPLTAETAKDIRFSASFGVNGSEQLQFTPVGKSTTVTLSSAWPHPSFTGNVLPQTTTVKDSGFVATWKSRGYKQTFPQQWKDDAYKLGNSGANALSTASFGADLFVPVSGYQKTMRSVKYSLLCLALTFAAFFLIETANNKSAHPFHYGLVGLALVLFYTLLLSFSEYIGFNLSYVVASLATVGLIGWFVSGVLLSGRLATLLSLVLVLLYGYVFTILQLQDYSLLLGSVGLFLTLAVVMRFAKKFQW